MYDLHIKGGIVVNPEHIFRADVYIKNQKIAQISDGEESFKSKKIIDATGNYVMPGFIDPHSHLNDPGLTESEDFYTGTCSAAAGGISTVMEHPLTFPLPSSPKAFIEKKKSQLKNALWIFVCSVPVFRIIMGMWTIWRRRGLLPSRHLCPTMQKYRRLTMANFCRIFKISVIQVLF